MFKQSYKKSCVRIILINIIILLCSLISANSFAKDCEIEIQYKKNISPTTSNSVILAGINEGENKVIYKNNLRFVKNKKSHKIRVLISRKPDSSQKKWVTLNGLNQKNPTASNYKANISIYRISCPVVNASTGSSSVKSCPKGVNAKVCSSNGKCNTSTGRCKCKNSDYSGSACQVMSQRCYGAIGNNCGAADGFNFGLCIGNRCKINAGSWEHDECCVKYRKNGPMPKSRQGSCTPLPHLRPFAQNCVVLFNKAVQHLAKPGLTWERRVNTSKKVSGIGSFRVIHKDMCNKSGGTLSCSDSKYCCSRRVTKTLVPGFCRCK